MPSFTLRTYWYVDIENVAERWTNLFDYMKQHDHLFLFYTPEHNKMELYNVDMLIRKMIHPHFVVIEPSGKNALDFAIMVEMGRQSLLKPNVKHVVVTGDMGFKSGIDYLNTFGVKAEVQDPGPTAFARLSAEERQLVYKARDYKGKESKLSYLHNLCQGSPYDYHKLKMFVK